MTSATELRLLTVADYHRMAESGILAADERVELIEGQIYRMVAKGTAHSAAVTRIARILSERLANQVLLRLQDPVQLSDLSEPEPDIAIVQSDRLDYEDHHPTPREIFGLIEVADSTLKRDLEVKAPLYARSGIAEYWVLDVLGRCLHVFRHPGDTNYEFQQQLEEEDAIAPLAFTDCVIQIAEFFQSRN
ncbi:Uma2 family endonuclease [Merismopedia glauca]|uniref:Putative restriction endonuclease domain-containing protein n=1 Tax=Merismopedia glauca CCAP 1448/3 TaxID=1296344 RepID=A0A2T1C471_9CYAN|nr:Uma2 family endonuclease [Merismopedia glauca]PSB03049.1 hypothetical protein C7B64_10315 [Merismopedia glauca CCAP 1448/3]